MSQEIAAIHAKLIEKRDEINADIAAVERVMRLVPPITKAPESVHKLVDAIIAAPAKVANPSAARIEDYEARRDHAVELRKNTRAAFAKSGPVPATPEQHAARSTPPLSSSVRPNGTQLVNTVNGIRAVEAEEPIQFAHSIPNRDRIRDLLNKDRSREWSTSAVAQALGHTNITGASTLLNEMANAGRIRRIRTGLFKSAL